MLCFLPLSFRVMGGSWSSNVASCAFNNQWCHYCKNQTINHHISSRTVTTEMTSYCLHHFSVSLSPLAWLYFSSSLLAAGKWFDNSLKEPPKRLINSWMESINSLLCPKYHWISCLKILTLVFPTILDYCTDPGLLC